MSKWFGIFMLACLSKIASAQDITRDNANEFSSDIYLGIGGVLIVIIIFVLVRRQKRRFND